MAIQIDIQTTGVSTLERAAAAFEKMSKSTLTADKAFAALSKGEKEALVWLDKMAKASGLATSQFLGMTEGLAATSKQLSNMATSATKAPFSTISRDLGAAKLASKAFRAEMSMLNKDIAAAGTGIKTQGIVIDKAALVLLQQVNAEYEKQAVLRAKVATLKGGGEANAALKETAVSLKNAQVATEGYAAALAKLAPVVNKVTYSEQKLATTRAALKQGGYQAQINAEEKLAAARASLAQGANQALINSEAKLATTRAALKQGGYQAQINAEEKLAAARQALAQGANQALINSEAKLATTRAALKQGGYQAQINAEQKLAAARASLAQGANQALINSETKLATTRAALKQGGYQAQINKEISAIKAQEAAITKLGSRMKSLKGGQLPIGEYAKLKAKVTALNVEMAKTGKVSKMGLAKLSADLRKVEVSARGASSAMKGNINVNKNLQGAIRGTAGALGGLWMSYGSILPMMAAFAAASAVKDVYALGTAFEYATTYADALGDSLSGIELPDLQAKLMNFEGLRQGPVDLADGMKEFAKAGVDTAVALEQVGEMSRFATVAEMDLGAATKLVIGQSKAFGVTFSEAANMVGAAALSSATDISELGLAMSFTTELASVAKISLDEAATGMAVMANRGIRGSKAATAMRTSILKMANATPAFKNRLDALGLSWSVFTDQGKIKNLKAMFAELQKVTKNLPDEQRVKLLADLFTVRAMKGGIALLAATGDEWDSMSEKIKTAAEGITFIQRKYDELEGTAKAAMERLGVAVEKSLLRAFDGDAVAGMMDSLAESVATDSFRDSLKTITSGINELGFALTGLISLATSTGVDFAEAGIVGYLIFGSNPIAKTIAGTGLAVKQINKLRAALMDPISNEILSKAFGEDYSPELAKQVGMLENLSGALYHAKLAAGGLRDELVEVVDRFMEMGKHSSLGLSLSGNQQDFGGSADEGVKAFAQWELKSKQVQTVLDQLNLDNATKSTSKWETALTKAKAKVDKIVADSKEQGIKFTPAEVEKFEGVATAGVNDTFAKKVQGDIDAINTASMVKEFEKAGDAVKIYGAMVEATQKKAELYAKDNGQWDAETDTFSSKGLEYYDALLRSKGLAVTATEKETAQVRILGAEMKKAFESEFGADSGGDGRASAYWTDYQEGIHTTLPLIDEWSMKLSEIDTKVAELANKQQLKTGEIDTQALDVYKEKLIWLEEYKGLQQIAKDTKELDFKIAINGTREAKDGMNKFEVSANNVKASYKELENAAYKYLKVKGQASKNTDGTIKFNSSEAEAYFKAATEGAGLFEKAIVAAKKEIRSMQDEMTDSAFSMDQVISKAKLSLLPDAQKEKAEMNLNIQALNQYVSQAKSALDGTAEGAERAMKMYQQAFSLEESMTPKTQGQLNEHVKSLEYLKDQILNLKQEDLDNAADSVGDLESEKEKNSAYITSLKEGYGEAGAAVEGYGKILTANGQEIATWANGQTTKLDAVIAKWRELNALQFKTTGGVEVVFPEGTPKEVVQAAKDYGKQLSANKAEVIELNNKTVKAAEGAKGAWEDAKAGMDTTGVTEESGTGVVKFGDKIVTWSNGSMKSIDGVNNSFKELAKTISSMPSAKLPSASTYGGEKALGGPVTSGTTYLVGEKGPELFSPRTSGVIIPNNKISGGSSEKMVDINLSIGGGSSVPLKGPQSSIDQIYKQMNSKARYAG